MTTRIQTFGGNIGIGTDDPGSFKLNVNGDIKADSLIINGVTNSQVPIGLIQIWYGTVETIPAGWVLCDGTTGITRSDGGGTIDTPDLRDRFVRGVSTAPQVGQSGGVNTITLSEANLAEHTHTFTSANSNAPHNHGQSSSSSAAHSHGESSQNNMPHGHPTGQNNAPHNHGESSDANMPHNHNAIAANMPHGHNAIAQNAPHSHVLESTNSNTQIGMGGGNKMRRTPVQLDMTTFNTPHNHGSLPTIEVGHTHPSSAHPGVHDHDIESVGGQHSHSIPISSGNASHTHTSVTDDNMPHPHTSSSSNMLHVHDGTTNQTGQGGSITVTNPYRLLVYIMKI